MKRKQRTAILVLVSAVVLIALAVYVLSLRKAEEWIHSIVKQQTDGKVELKIENLTLDLTELSFELKNAEFYTIDVPTDTTGYHVVIPSLVFNVKSLFTYASKGHFVIDSIIVQSPRVKVIKYFKKENTQVSLPKEIKTVYDWLAKTVNVVNLNYLNITNAQFIIADKSTDKPYEILLKKVNLLIDDVSKGGTDKESRFMFAQNIVFEIGSQNLHFPDRNKGISFKRFRFESLHQQLQLDSCVYYANTSSNKSESFRLFADSVLVKRLNLADLASNNVLRLDSALCHNPVLTVKLKQTTSTVSKRSQNTSINKDSLLNKIGNLIGKVDIGYLAVKNASVDISSEVNKRISSYASKKSNFSMSQLKVDTQSENPISIAAIKLNVTAYTGYLPDSLYQMKFDEISFENNKLLLHNFQLQPTVLNKHRIKQRIKIDVFELADIDWATLLFEQELNAKYATLINPNISIISEGVDSKSKSQTKLKPFAALASIKKRVEIGEWFVRNANLLIKVKQGAEIQLLHTDLSVDVTKLLDADNELTLVYAIDNLKFQRGVYKDGLQTVSLYNGSYNAHADVLSIANVEYVSRSSDKKIEISGLSVKNVDVIGRHNFEIDEINWEYANAQLQPKADANIHVVSHHSDLQVNVHSISGKNTSVSYANSAITTGFVIDFVSSGRIRFNKGKLPQISGFKLNGRNFYYTDAHSSLKAQFVNITDSKTSQISKVNAEMRLSNKKLYATIPSVNFRLSIAQLLDGHPDVDFIELNAPEILLLKNSSPLLPSSNSKLKTELPLFSLRQIALVSPVFNDLNSGKSFTAEKGEVVLKNIVSDGKSIGVANLQLQLMKPIINTSGIKVQSIEPHSTVQASIKDVMFWPSTMHYKANVEKISLSNLLLRTDSVSTLKVFSFETENLNIDGLNKNHAEFISNNSGARTRKVSLEYNNGRNITSIYNLCLDKGNTMLTVDSMHLRPVLNPDDYMMLQKWQSIYTDLKFGKLIMHQFDIERFIITKQMRVRKMEINDMLYAAYKDKRLPFRHDVVKPLPTELLKNLSLDIKVDTVLLRNSMVKYREFIPTTNSTGLVEFSKLRGIITNILSRNISDTDSLKFNISGNFANATTVKVNYAQSYADSLSTFHLKVILARMDMKKLNPVLRAFASAEIISGKLDTLRMSAIGRKYLAVGVMRMYYSGLNVRYLDSKSQQKTTFVGKALSFVANLLLNSYNKLGVNHVYAERDPEKGFANYWLKIVLSGAMTNAGVSTDKKLEHKYQKALKTHKVPPIENIPEEY